ncbi:MAG: carbon monoxide dehydrogenase, partial [Burkholderiaceae bacterium]
MLSAVLNAASVRVIDPGALLRSRLTGFAGFLRANGFALGGADSVRVLETALHTGVLEPQVMRWSLKALLCGRGDEWRRFDALFDAYFLPPNKQAFVQSDALAAAAGKPNAQAQGADADEPGEGAGRG